MVKNKILELIDNKKRLTYFRFNFNELCEIFNKTKFLHYNTKINERCYCIIHNINSQPKCLKCGNKTKFMRLSNGYRTFCSCKCKNDYLLKHTDISHRISETIKIYHKNLPKEERNKQQLKRLETMIAQKIIVPYKSLSEREQYYKQVWFFTNQQNLKLLPNYEKRGKEYQLDHKFSIIAGFINNIPPYIIGNINNLEMLSTHDNTSKQGKCSITKEELFKLYFDESSTTIPYGSTHKRVEVVI